MPISIVIEGDGLSFKKEIDTQRAGQIISFLGMNDNSIGSQMDRLGTTPNLTTLALRSPGELIVESEAKTNAEKIAVVGNYLVQKNSQENFSAKEVLAELQKLGEKPGNFSRDLRTAQELQYIYALDVKKGLFGISNKAREAISSKFSDIIRPKIRSGSSRGGHKKAVPPREDVLSLPVVASMEGYVDFHQMPTKADSILWLLAYSEVHGLDGLTPKEVEALSDRLRNKIAHRDFSAHNNRNIKKSYVALTGNMYKLQQKGKDYLVSLGLDKKNDTNE